MLWCVAAFVEGLGMKENDSRIAVYKINGKLL